MLNPLIKEQLNKCEVADIPSFDDNTLELIIPKKSKEKNFQLNKYYIVELADYLINPGEIVSFHINWNQGRVPKSKYLKVCISQLMGKMIKVDGIGFNPKSNEDLEDFYTNLWLPSNDVKIVKEI